MVRVNFIWVLAALGAALTVLWLLAAGASKQADAAREAYAKTRQSVDRIERLKKEWENNPAARGRIESLLNEERFKRLGGTVNKSATGLKAEVNGMDAALVNALTRQLLQAPVALKSLSFERRSDQAVDMVLEVGP